VETKTTQLQIRISRSQKQKLRQQARRAGMSVAEWVLSHVFPAKRDEFERLVHALGSASERRFAWANVHDFLARLEAGDIERVLAEPASAKLTAPDDALLAAMIEHAAVLKEARIPGWVARTPPASVPFFASDLKSLRVHLLSVSPPAFRRRNLFVDTSVGGRV
jgi:hypothetical protein